MTLREQLRRARPVPDSLTYRRLTNSITEQEYQKQLKAERDLFTRSNTKKQAASS